MNSHSPEQAAIASDLVRRLTAYEEGLRQLLQGGWDPDLYRALSDQFDEMQVRATQLPTLASSWTELLVSRVDLTHALWTLSSPTRVNGKVVAFHARHRMLIEEMRRQCRSYTAGGERMRA